MTDDPDEYSAAKRQDTVYGNINLKVTEGEKWAFKEWCARHRMSQVEAFRRAFELLKNEQERGEQ